MQVGESLLGVKHAYDLISKVDIFALFLLQLVIYNSQTPDQVPL